jgi:hypothetical protein
VGYHQRSLAQYPDPVYSGTYTLRSVDMSLVLISNMDTQYWCGIYRPEEITVTGSDGVAGEAAAPPSQRGPERVKQSIHVNFSFANDPPHLFAGRFEKTDPVTGIVCQAGGRRSREPGDDQHVSGSPADIEGCYQDDR